MILKEVLDEYLVDLVDRVEDSRLVNYQQEIVQHELRVLQQIFAILLKYHYQKDCRQRYSNYCHCYYLLLLLEQIPMNRLEKK